MTSGWYVIKFPEENAIEVVPSNWICNDKKTCVWPLYVRSKLQEAIKSREDPAEDWTTYNISFLSNKLYDKFMIANSRATKAKFTSDISSAAESFNEESSEEFSSDTSLEFPDVPLIRPNKRKTSKISSDTPAKKKHIANISTIESPMERASSKIFLTPVKKKSMAEIRGSSLPLVSSPLASTVHSESFIHRKNRDEENCAADTFQKQVMRHLVSINVLLKEHSYNLDKITDWINEQKNNDKEKELHNVSSKEVLDEFPITDNAKMELMEDNLVNNEGNFQLLISAIAKIGGENANEFIRRSMNRILSNEVAAEYSWQGHKGKKQFKKLKIATAIISAAKKSTVASQITEKQIEMSIAKWLSKAPERMKRSN